jgi:uncharacterized membrane protein YbhN (UPF0104 family)
MTDSLRAFADAVEAFGAQLAAVDWRLLALAAAFGVLNLVVRARAWENILRAALPGSPVRYRNAFGAYCGGVGVNAIVPARAGDLVRILLIRRGLPEAPYPLLVGTLLAETVFDMAIASLLIAWVVWAGLLPGVRLPDIPAFDLSLAFRHPWVTVALVALLVLGALLTAGRIRRFWQQLGDGLTVLRTPWRYLRTVAPWQALGWCFRVAGAYFFLAAFGLPQTLTNALIVIVAGNLGGLFPATPAGVGPKQALIVVMLAGEAGRSTVLAFSAGMEVTLVAVNVVVGFVCIAVMMRTVRFRRVLGRARAQEPAVEPPSAPPSAPPGPEG